MKRLPLILCLALVSSFASSTLASPSKHRVIVTSDIGGTDPDDYQSMAHVLLYGDTLDIEGLVSSPFEREGKTKILEVIDAYEQDFANLSTWSADYPTPDSLRSITKQGGIHPAPYSGLRGTTEGSEWIVECARRDDSRPLHILVWGAIEEVAQALHDAPDILPKLRVYYIGGPNKKWGPDAYQYIADNFPTLFIVESNATYRGYFTGGDPDDEWGKNQFVKQHVAGRGAIGSYFSEHLGGVIKMGDTPSVNWVLRGDPGQPSLPGWGGRFVRAWDRPFARHHRLTTADDRLEIFGVLELVLPLGPDAPKTPEGHMIVTNQKLAGYPDGEGNLRFRFCARDPKVFTYTIESNDPALDGKQGAITAYLPDPEVSLTPSIHYPNWWTDDPTPAMAEGIHHGAKSVSQWREAFMRDFADRMERCAKPRNPESAQAPTPAFPTAEGFGMMASGGRGGQVIEVTNVLDDAKGETVGSLRWALKQSSSGPTTIVFRTSGIINLVSDLRHKCRNLTIAGQTAPGDGICIRGQKVNLGGSDNLIMRHLRFRIGLHEDGTFVDGGSIGMENAKNIIIDHCTFGWSGEENMTMYDNDFTTVQWSIVHEGLYASGHGKGVRSYGAQWGGQNATYHHNLLAHNVSRTPRFNGSKHHDVTVNYDYINNVNYNWAKPNSAYGAYIEIEDGSFRCNFINNYYKPGPARPGDEPSFFAQSSHHSIQGTDIIAKWHMDGNYMEGPANQALNADNALGLDAQSYERVGVPRASLIATEPFARKFPVSAQSAHEAYRSVLSYAGAFPRDSVDERIVEEVRTGTASGKGTVEKHLNKDGKTYSENKYYAQAKGIIDNPIAAFGEAAYPKYETFDTIVDKDQDGMDDAWETANDLDPSNSDDRNKLTRSGYTSLEVYLNSLAGESIALVF